LYNIVLETGQITSPITYPKKWGQKGDYDNLFTFTEE